jgi:hypothetical protein
MTWNEAPAERHIHNFAALTTNNRQKLLAYLNEHFPLATFEYQRSRQQRALHNMEMQRSILSGATQRYPSVINAQSLSLSPQNMDHCVFMFTAGGDGERLRLSLLKKGYSPDTLHDFTKATFPLPGFVRDFGALQINLALVSELCRSLGRSIPVIVSTGPAGSQTARVIPQIIAAHNNFGIDQLTIVEQDERLHLTLEGKIVWIDTPSGPRPATNPDETGGPLMKIRSAIDPSAKSTLGALRESGYTRLFILQGTAVYSRDLLQQMAAAALDHDAIGVGIPRSSFPAEDPYGTYILLEKEGRESLHIIEQDIRNDATRHVRSPNGKGFLPYNTGFYALDIDYLQKNALPDFATPPKEIIPGIPMAPKIGYAATDVFPCAARPAILTIPADSFAVIKNDQDLQRCTDHALRFGLDTACATFPA